MSKKTEDQPKFVQIAVDASRPPHVFALDENGDVWVYSGVSLPSSDHDDEGWERLSRERGV